MHETDISFITEKDWGGIRSISYGYNEDGRKGKGGARGFRHATNVYTIITGGEVLPPLYIFDSSAQNISNYQVQPV